jgi:hypothetical protein
MKGKNRFAVEDFQNWMVIALGARVSEDGEGATVFMPGRSKALRACMTIQLLAFEPRGASTEGCHRQWS